MALHNNVTGSCIQLVIKLPNNEGYKILIDCGLFQGLEEWKYNEDFKFKANNIDYVLVTHNHIDHTGRLPLLIRNGYSKKIYCTPATRLLMPYALMDCAKVLKDVSKLTKTKVLYDDGDVFETIAKLEEVEFEQTKELNDYIKVTFFKNGHLLGAAMILLQIQYYDEPPINLLFTGDYNNRNRFFDVPPLPDWVNDLSLTVIQESTYGDEDTETVTPCFRENIAQKMQKNGGTVIIPVFSLGRFQEVLKTLREMQDEGMLDSSIPIFCDGKLGIQYTKIYLKDGYGLKDECLDFLPRGSTFVDETIRSSILYSSEDKIIVTTSGSGTYGPAPQYIQHYISNPNALIHFTGFQFEGSLGRTLKDTQKGEEVKVNGAVSKRFADVEYTGEFSAHAKGNQMLEFLNKFNKLNAVLVNHGEQEVKVKFAERIEKQTNAKKIRILDRTSWYRIGAWGIAKEGTSKFD